MERNRIEHENKDCLGAAENDTQADQSADQNTIQDAETDVMPESAAIPANLVHHCTGKNDGTDTTTWSYVYFGSYPQSEVTDSTVIAAIDNTIAAGNGTTGADNTGTDVWVNGTKYRRIRKEDTNHSGYFDEKPANNGYRYFKYQICHR